ncbi:MAG: hypothetical protein AAGA48_02575 [Myxococcota bacterium]
MRLNILMVWSGCFWGLLGCGTSPEEPVEAAPSTNAAFLIPPGGSGITNIEGSVFYDDFRRSGRFSLRKDPTGANGTRVLFPGFGTGEHNYLAAYDMTVKVYEVDPITNPNTNCVTQTFLGTTTVKADGSFRVPVDDRDPCMLETNRIPDIAVEISLRYCDADRCLSVREDDDTQGAGTAIGAVHALWHPTANLTNPVEMPPGSPPLPRMNFQLSDYDMYAMAAGLFASAVDVTRKFYVEAGIHRVRSEEFSTEFPDNVGRASVNGFVAHMPMPDPNDPDVEKQWVGGGGLMHELGHSMHYDVWDRSLGGGCGVGPLDQRGGPDEDGWNADSREWPLLAFREAIASFVKRATLEGEPLGGCDSGIYDENSSPVSAGLQLVDGFDEDDADGDSNRRAVCNADPLQYPDEAESVSYPSDGQSYQRNIIRLLCDWLDTGTDDDPALPGPGDDIDKTLAQTWKTLEDMWDQRLTGDDCLDVCDFLDYHVQNEIEPPWVMGVAAHELAKAKVTNLAFNNAISCGAPAAAPPMGCWARPGSAPPPFDFESCLIDTGDGVWCSGVGPAGEVAIDCEPFMGTASNNVTMVEGYGAPGDIVVYGTISDVGGPSNQFCCLFDASDTSGVTDIYLETNPDVASTDIISLTSLGDDVGLRDSRIQTFGGNDFIYGGPGVDTVFAGDGDDSLFTYEGNDTLNGGAGTDHCEGGGGQDLFVAIESNFGILQPTCSTGRGYVTLRRDGDIIGGAVARGACPGGGEETLDGSSGYPDSLTVECDWGDTLSITCSYSNPDDLVRIHVDGVSQRQCTSSPCTHSLVLGNDADVACVFEDYD